MAKRQKAWARRERARLVRILKPTCQMCKISEGEDHPITGKPARMELDVIKSCGPKHHGMDSSRRISFYRAQFRLGNLQVLCSNCNSLKGNRVILPPLSKESLEYTKPPVLGAVNTVNNLPNVVLHGGTPV